MSCIFCDIANHKQEADVVYEDRDVIAFNDIHPKAPLHVLIVPKKHIASVNDLNDKDVSLAGNLILTAGSLAKKLGVAEGGYKLLFNVGRGGGQEIFHVHLHLLGYGKNLSDSINK